MTDNCGQHIEELEREVEKLRKELNKLKAGQEWMDGELEDYNKRLTVIEKVLDVYYDKDKGAWRSRFLSRIYATLMKHERKLFPQQRLK